MNRGYYLGALALILAAALATAWLWPSLPETVPMHWNVAGKADDFGPKWQLWLLGPLLMAALVLLFLALPWLSPRHFEIARSGNTYLKAMLVVLTMHGYLYGIVLWTIVEGALDHQRAMLGGISVALVALGNLLGKLRRNFYVGIRTPWTLADEGNWYATHRFGGKSVVVTGLAGGLAVLAGATLAVWLAITILGAFLPVGYSLWYFRQHGASGGAANPRSPR